MVAKILSSAASFNGVNYNTNKIDDGRGELMHVANFGPLQGLNNLRPEDYKSYLQAVSSRNGKIELPQLHAVLSCLGKEYDKDQLTEMGKQWLDEMGYGENPYLIIFHKDTENNHVHLVSTRVDKKGNKINSDYERIRSINVMNNIVGLDEKQKLSDDIKKSLDFNYKTKAQFLLLLERKGYTPKLMETGRGVELIKYGVKVGELDNEVIQSGINNLASDPKRIAQIRAFIEKYRVEYSAKLYMKTITAPSGAITKLGFTSDLSEHLKEKFGIDLVFHAKDDKAPYGFSIIDNAQKNVFKGGEIISLKELLNDRIRPEAAVGKVPEPYKVHMENRVTSADELSYYKTLVRSVINDYGFLQEGLQQQGFDVVNKSNDLFIVDIQGSVSIKLIDLMPAKSEEYEKLASFNNTPVTAEIEIFQESLASITFGGSDIDDEAILGRNRARKGMARTNRR